MKLPILAASRFELCGFLHANPWLSREHVVHVTEPGDLRAFAGLLLALPGWNLSASIKDPRGILEAASARGMQLVVLEHAAFDYGRPPPPPPTVEFVGSRCRDRMAELELAERFNRESG